MGLEQLKKEILDKAQREAAAMVREAEREADSILAGAKMKAREYEKEAEVKHTTLLEDIEKGELANARFEARKLLLDEKKTFIEQAFTEVEKALAVLPEKKREALIMDFLSQAKKEIQVRCVYANAKDRKLVEKSGFLFKERDLLGGIIAETMDGTISVDLSFEEMLRQLKEHKLQEIAQRLF